MGRCSKTALAVWANRLLGLVSCLVIAVSGCSPEPVPERVRLTDLWVAANPQVHEFAPQARIGNTTRIGIPVPIGETVRVPLAIPPGSVLRARVGLVENAADARSTRGRVDVSICSSSEAGGQGAAVGQALASAEAWTPLELDLSAFATSQTGLCFAASGVEGAPRLEPASASIWLANATLEPTGSPTRPPGRFNLILITQGPAATGPTPARDAGSSSLERLVREGEVYSHAMFNAPTIGPATASLMTGLHPGEQGQAGGPHASQLSPEVLVLAELFWALGHGTAGFVSESELGSDLGFARAHDVYDESTANRVGLPAAQRVDLLIGASLEWIESQSGSFFLFLNLPSEDSPQGTLDRALRKLLERLDELGLYDETMLVVAAAGEDSAPVPLEESQPAVSGLLDAELRHRIHMKYPAVRSASRRGRELDHRVDSLDLHATILREFGLAREGNRSRDPDAPPDFPGRYGLNEPREYHFAEARSGDEHEARARKLEAVYHGDWKLVRDDRGFRWLFDLTHDPHETVNLIDRQQGVGARLLAVLDAWRSGGRLCAPRDQTGHYPPALVELILRSN